MYPPTPPKKSKTRWNAAENRIEHYFVFQWVNVDWQFRTFWSWRAGRDFTKTAIIFHDLNNFRGKKRKNMSSGIKMQKRSAQSQSVSSFKHIHLVFVMCLVGLSVSWIYIIHYIYWIYTSFIYLKVKVVSWTWTSTSRTPAQMNVTTDFKF